MTIRIGSMCTGYGGLDAGVMAVFGGQLAWVADNDKGCSKILAHRLPGVPNLGDIKTADWENTEPVDILCTGFPCQPVSGAGRQKGMSDDRWLWPWITQAAGRMGAPPRLLVLENVPGLLTIDGGAAMAQIIYSLAALGYVGRYGLFRASDAGAPHRRERWFCLAYHIETALHTESIRRGVGRQPGRQRGEREQCGLGSAERSEEADTHTQRDRLERSQQQIPGEGEERLRRRPANQGAAATAHAALVRWAERRPGTDGHWASASDSGPDQWAGIDWRDYEPAIRRWEQVTSAAPAPVEPGKNGKPRLAGEFSEWMMGLPPGWVTEVPDLSRSAKLKAIGNGVVPQQAAMAVSHLWDQL